MGPNILGREFIKTRMENIKYGIRLMVEGSIKMGDKISERFKGSDDPANDIIIEKFSKDKNNLEKSFPELVKEMDKFVSQVSEGKLEKLDENLEETQKNLVRLKGLLDSINNDISFINKKFDNNDMPNLQSNLYRLDELSLAESLEDLKIMLTKVNEGMEAGSDIHNVFKEPTEEDGIGSKIVSIITKPFHIFEREESDDINVKIITPENAEPNGNSDVDIINNAGNIYVLESDI